MLIPRGAGLSSRQSLSNGAVNSRRPRKHTNAVCRVCAAQHPSNGNQHPNSTQAAETASAPHNASTPARMSTQHAPAATARAKHSTTKAIQQVSFRRSSNRNTRDTTKSGNFNHHSSEQKQKTEPTRGDLPPANGRKRSPISTSLFAATHREKIAQIVAQQSSIFEADDVALALDRLARLARSDRNAVGSSHVDMSSSVHNLLPELLLLTDRLLNNFNAKQIVMILWALATLMVQDRALISKLLARTEGRTHTLKAYQLCTLMFACGKLQHRPSNKLMRDVAKACIRQKEGLDPRGLSSLVWAYARMGYLDKNLMQAACERTAACLDGFSGQGISNFLWGCAKLHYLQSDDLLAELEAAAVQRADQSSAQSISNSLWALSVLHYKPQRLLDKVGQIPDAYFLHCVPNDISQVVTACARSGITHQRLLTYLLAQLPRGRKRIRANDMAAILSGLGQLAYFPPSGTSSLCVALQSCLPHLQGRELSNCLWGMAVQQQLRPAAEAVWPDELLAQLLEKATAHSDSFSLPQQLANVSWAAATLEHPQSDATVQKMACAASQMYTTQKFSPEELSVLLWSVAMRVGSDMKERVGRESVRLSSHVHDQWPLRGLADGDAVGAPGPAEVSDWVVVTAGSKGATSVSWPMDGRTADVADMSASLSGVEEPVPAPSLGAMDWDRQTERRELPDESRGRGDVRSTANEASMMLSRATLSEQQSSVVAEQGGEQASAVVQEPSNTDQHTAMPRQAVLIAQQISIVGGQDGGQASAAVQTPSGNGGSNHSTAPSEDGSVVKALHQEAAADALLAVELLLAHGWDRFKSDPSSFNGQDVTLLLWSQSKMGLPADATDIATLCVWLHERLQQLEVRQLAMLLWALARQESVHHPVTVLQDIEQRLFGHLSSLKAYDLAMVTHSLGRLQHQPQLPFLEVLADAAAERIDDFKQHEMVNTLWGFASLEYHPGPFVGLVARRMSKAEHVEQWQARTLNWCYSQLGFSLARYK